MITEQQALEIAQQAGLDTFYKTANESARMTVGTHKNFTRALNLAAAMALESASAEFVGTWIRDFALAQQVLEGWVLVPKEPTPEQRDVMREAGHQYVVRHGRYDNGMMDGIYKAMIAAAPKEPEWGSREYVSELLKEEPSCNPHPDAPHGFDRNGSHNAGRYVCDCEGWEPEEESK